MGQKLGVSKKQMTSKKLQGTYPAEPEICTQGQLQQLVLSATSPVSSTEGHFISCTVTSFPTPRLSCLRGFLRQVNLI